MKIISIAVSRKKGTRKTLVDRARVIVNHYQAGDCIMPREGVFARVIQGGEIACGDAIELFATSVGASGRRLTGK